jgi:putative membrane protein
VHQVVSPVAADHAWSERVLLAALGAVTVAAAAGYATFALHPERLAALPDAAPVYGLALRVFPPAHIIIGVGALAAILTRRTGAAWIPAAAVLYVLSLSSEMLGTTVGLPFGPYRYTDGLGVKWFAHVPVLIPASWFMMALPSFVLVTRFVSARAVPRIVFAAVLLVSWDLALDPAMSRLMPYWVWGRTGPYYGMPLLNLAGWYVTALALMLALTLLRIDRWSVRVPTAAFAAIYLANLALPALMALAAGIWPAAILAVVPVTLAGLAGMRRRDTA